MGSRKWDGLPLYAGYTALINGKEIEVDSQISQKHMPAIAGKSLEYENDIEFGSPPSSQAGTSSPFGARSSSIGTSAAQRSPVTNAPSASKPYVAPSSFYGHQPAKPKPTGPL